MKEKILIIFLTAIIVGGGVYFWQQDSEKEKSSNKPRFEIAEPVVAPVDQQPLPEQGNIIPSVQEGKEFNITTAKVGDIVKGLKVISVKPLLNSGREIKFEGQLTLTGKYSFSDFGSQYIFSDLENESKEKLPNLGYEPWFFFSNQNLAEKEFGPQENSGTATVIINNFTMAMIPGTDAGGNFATLVKVLKK